MGTLAQRIKGWYAGLGRLSKIGVGAGIVFVAFVLLGALLDATEDPPNQAQQEQAVDHALGAEAPAPPAAPKPKERAPTGGSPDVLTLRQREVALLVARGLASRQVAAELVLPEHTVATHVREILKKLGLQSRTELAAWTNEQKLLP